MSDTHGQSLDAVEPLVHLDHNATEEVAPVSHGISKYMWMFLAASILIAVMQGSFVVASSGAAHVWPAGTAIKAPLPPLAK
jgi:hypothetical protein